MFHLIKSTRRWSSDHPVLNWRNFEGKWRIMTRCFMLKWFSFSQLREIDIYILIVSILSTPAWVNLQCFKVKKGISFHHSSFFLFFFSSVVKYKDEIRQNLMLLTFNLDYFLFEVLCWNHLWILVQFFIFIIYLFSVYFNVSTIQGVKRTLLYINIQLKNRKSLVMLL